MREKMEVSDFRITVEAGERENRYTYAEVTVTWTTGVWFLKRTHSNTFTVFQKAGWRGWYFLRDGSLAEGFNLEDQADAWRARQALANRPESSQQREAGA